MVDYLEGRLGCGLGVFSEKGADQHDKEEGAGRPGQRLAGRGPAFAQDQPEAERQARDGAHRHADGEAADGGRAFEGAVDTREEGGETDAHRAGPGNDTSKARQQRGEAARHRKLALILSRAAGPGLRSASLRVLRAASTV